MVQKGIEEIKEILNSKIEYLKNKYSISLLYVFGSYATGKNNGNSDLDIAILLKDNYVPMAKLELLGDLNIIFKRDDIDLVILNSASPVLKFQVVKYGAKLYMEDEVDKVNFEAKVVSEYMDMEPFRRRQNEISKMRMDSFKGGI